MWYTPPCVFHLISEKTFPVKFYLEKKWFIALNLSVAFLISKRASQNRNYSLILDVSLAGGLKVGLLRTSNACVQLHAEWREHSWEIHQDLLRFPEERLVIRKYDIIWQRYACMSSFYVNYEIVKSFPGYIDLLCSLQSQVTSFAVQPPTLKGISHESF